MKKCLFYFITISIVFMNENPNVLVLSPNSTIDPQYLDESDIGTINTLFVDGLNQYIDNIETSDVFCLNDDCALEELSKTDNNEVVYTRLQKLGSKIIFSASILDLNTSFDSKATAINIEDMEQVCLRLSKSIALRQTLEEAADIDNITEKEEEEVARRKSLGRVGLSLGYFFPLDDLVYTETDWQGVSTEKTYSQMLKFSLNYYNEFKNNTALICELGLSPPVLTLIDLNFLKFKNKIDTSPFYGGGVGFYTVRKDDAFPSSSSSDAGMSFNLQGGALLYRTYDINVLLRVKLIQIFNEQLDRGIMFDIGVQWKMKTRSRDKTVVVNRYPILERIFDRN